MSLHQNPENWILTTAGGIPYKLYEGFPTGEFEEEKATITEKLIIESYRLMDFIREYLSDYEAWPGGKWTVIPAKSYGSGAANAAQISPGSDGDSAPELGSMVVQKIQFEPFPPGRPGDPFEIHGADRVNWDEYEMGEFGEIEGGPGDPAEQATFAEFVTVTITYAPGKSTKSVDDLLEIQCSATGEFLMYTTQGRNANWEHNDGTTTTAKTQYIPVTKLQPGNEWTLKYKRVPWEHLSESIAAMRAAMGKINSAYMPALREANLGTVLFVSFSYTTVYSWREIKPFAEIEVKLLEKRVIDDAGDPVGHNWFLNPENGKFELLGIGTTGAYVYEQTDLNALLFGAADDPTNPLEVFN